MGEREEVEQIEKKMEEMQKEMEALEMEKQHLQQAGGSSGDTDDQDNPTSKAIVYKSDTLEMIKKLPSAEYDLLSADGSVFVNVGFSNTKPLVAMLVAQHFCAGRNR
eukprot:SAG22_NODE_2638_length_2347_cov_2.305605_5_plen_107_part_00